MQRPGEVTAIALYHALFSCVLVGALVIQCIFHRPSDGWVYAAPVIAMLLFVSLIPAVICFGLWIMDDGARVACILFTILHLIVTVIYLRQAPTFWRPWVRIAIDAVIIAVLMMPRIRQAFDRESSLLLDWSQPLP
jgi:hypothetical protein